MLPDKLVYMANQIAMFFAPQKNIDPVALTADHLKKFWEPRMRKSIIGFLDRGGEGLNPIARAAVELLRTEELASTGKLVSTPPAQPTH